MKKERKSNIELLRILAMFLIISFHYVYKSGYTFETLSINNFIIKSFWLFGELGVNLFILITGYFMINGRFSFKKLILLMMEVLFYYLFSVLISTRVNNWSIQTFKDGFLLFFPVILNKYWFITVYILVYILSPYLNIFIKSMNRKTFLRFIITTLILWCIIPTFFGLFFNSTEKMLYYSRFIWFIIMYCVGAYIKLYSLKSFEKISKCFISALISFLIMLIGIVIIYKFSDVFKKIGTTEIAYFWPPNTLPMFILSISIFEIFLKIKMNSCKIINILASTTLGIYMIHDGVLNRYIWDKIFMTKQHLNNKYFLIYIVGTTIIIYLLGTIVDLIRQLIEKNTIKRILNSKKCENIANKIKNIISKKCDSI